MNPKFFTLIIFSIFMPLFIYCGLFHQEPDENWNDKEMIENRGFKYEIHNVVTEDCYILELHRIINPKDQTPNKPPVLCMHELLGSSTSFLFNSIGGYIDDFDDRNLGFALAKRGYDVYLANVRGNYYSRKHKIYNKTDREFWKFTFDNHALQDLPATIAYIQNFTNYDQIGYVGFSQGTQIMFLLLSLKPEIAKTISPYVALGPVAYQTHTKSFLSIPRLAPTLLKALLFYHVEFLPKSAANKLVSTLICTPFPALICENFLYATSGYSSNQLNKTRIPVYLQNLPAGTSLANTFHFELNIHYKKFQLLDYLSEQQNMECYGKKQPPLVPIENIILKSIYLIHGGSDLLSTPADVQLLKDTLKVNFESKFIENFEHLDFILSQNVDVLVNECVFKALEDNTPLKKVKSDQKLRLKLYTTETCKSPKKHRNCHLDLRRALKRMY